MAVNIILEDFLYMASFLSLYSLNPAVYFSCADKCHRLFSSPVPTGFLPWLWDRSSLSVHPLSYQQKEGSSTEAGAAPPYKQRPAGGGTPVPEKSGNLQLPGRVLDELCV